jgi:hypothetical protein
MNFIILAKECIDGSKLWVAYDENSRRLCSDTNYDDCLIKCGLLGLKMNPLPLNSWPARRIEMKARLLEL